MIHNLNVSAGTFSSIVSGFRKSVRVEFSSYVDFGDKVCFKELDSNGVLTGNFIVVRVAGFQGHPYNGVYLMIIWNSLERIFINYIEKADKN